MTVRISKKSIQSARFVRKATTHPAERCWRGAGAHLKPKNLKLEATDTNDTSTSQSDANTKPTTSIMKNPKKLDSPQLQMNEQIRVRQYIISDPPSIFYTGYYSLLKNTPSAD